MTTIEVERLLLSPRRLKSLNGFSFTVSSLSLGPETVISTTRIVATYKEDSKGKGT